MKILSSILLSLIIIISTSGIFVSEHFCCNKLMSVSFFTNAKKCCDNNCPYCKNINHSYKVKTKVIQSQTINLKPNNSVTYLFLLPSNKVFTYITIPDFSLEIVIPPLIKENLNILFSIFRL